jgi:hypothetical protein
VDPPVVLLDGGAVAGDIQERAVAEAQPFDRIFFTRRDQHRLGADQHRLLGNPR